jgi:hypothetical protein
MMNEARDWLLHPRQQWEWRRRHATILRQIAARSRTRDPIENSESTPPVDEQIRLQAVWMAESYPPSFFDSLLDVVRRLTVDESDFSSYPPVQHLEEALRLGGSGWIPLGPLIPPGSPLFELSRPIETALPSHVAYANASVHYLVPSQAMLVVCFVLDEVGSQCVEKTLRATYRSYTTEHRRWTTTQTPGNQKRAAVRTKRAQQLTELASFFRREAPGLFASDSHLLPSIEFWTTKDRRPFDEDQAPHGRPGLNDFISLLGWVPWMDAWPGPDNLVLKQAPVIGDALWSRAPNLQLVAREDDLFAGDDMKMYGGRSREAYVSRLGDGVGPLVAALALTETFRFYEAELVDSRRRLREAQSQSVRRRVKATVAVQDRLLRQQADVQAVARGVARWNDHLLELLGRSSIDFERWMPPSRREQIKDGRQLGKPVLLPRWLARLAGRAGESERAKPEFRPWPRESWLEDQVQEIRMRAEYVVTGAREISDVVRATSETTSTQASLRFQRQVALLTFLLVGLGIATIVVVVITAK